MPEVIRQRDWPKPVDITGQRFGYWTVLSSHDSIRRGGGRRGKDKIVTKWFCQCDCGTTKSFYRFQLTGNKSSKRCQRCGRTKDPNATAAHSVMRDYQRSAFKRDIKWELTFEEFVSITSSRCFYTGREPSQVRTALNGKNYMFNGIDRLDSSKGYTKENCVPCCAEVNRAKMDMIYDEFLSLVKEISSHWGWLCQK